MSFQIGYIKHNDNTTLADNRVIVSTKEQLILAISKATAGQTIYVKSGTYSIGTLTINKSGTSKDYITIRNYPNETSIITGSRIVFSSSCKYLNFIGFLIKDLTNLDWETCIEFKAGSSYINFKNNEITNIKCKNNDTGCNPLVLYGDSSKHSINNITIENNYVHDCCTGWSEAITCNGNVENCNIIQNTVDSNGNIGIDLAGNFSWTGTVGSTTNQARFITVARNYVANCQSTYATSAGIYCDGGRDNTFEYNIVYNCQCGIELGAEEPGAIVQNFYVRNNLIINSGRSIGVGAYLKTGATHKNSYIYNNTIVCGNSNKENYGLYLERTSDVYFYNNIIYGASGTTLYENNGGKNIYKGNNCWYKAGGSIPLDETKSIFKEMKV